MMVKLTLQAAPLYWISPIRDQAAVETVDETTETPLVLEEVAVAETFQPSMDPNSVEDALARATITPTIPVTIGTTIIITIATAIIIVEATNKTSQWVVVVLLQDNDPV